MCNSLSANQTEAPACCSSFSLVSLQSTVMYQQSSPTIFKRTPTYPKRSTSQRESHFHPQIDSGIPNHKKQKRRFGGGFWCVPFRILLGSKKSFLEKTTLLRLSSKNQQEFLIGNAACQSPSSRVKNSASHVAQPLASQFRPFIKAHV